MHGTLGGCWCLSCNDSGWPCYLSVQSRRAALASLCNADMQVNLQENFRNVQVHSSGGAISCKLPPSIGAVPAVLQPRDHVKLGEGIQFEVCLAR